VTSEDFDLALTDFELRARTDFLADAAFGQEVMTDLGVAAWEAGTGLPARRRELAEAAYRSCIPFGPPSPGWWCRTAQAYAAAGGDLDEALRRLDLADESAARDDYGPAYRAGVDARTRYSGSFDDNESTLRSDWESVKGKSRLTWEQAKQGARAAWHRVERKLPGDADNDGQITIKEWGKCLGLKEGEIQERC